VEIETWKMIDKEYDYFWENCQKKRIRGMIYLIGMQIRLSEQRRIKNKGELEGQPEQAL
jgi:hypothetical protein